MHVACTDLSCTAWIRCYVLLFLHINHQQQDRQLLPFQWYTGARHRQADDLLLISYWRAHYRPHIQPKPQKTEMLSYEDLIVISDERICTCTWIGLRTIILPGEELDDGCIAQDCTVDSGSIPVQVIRCREEASVMVSLVSMGRLQV